jgi:hypothetical protein
VLHSHPINQIFVDASAVQRAGPLREVVAEAGCMAEAEAEATALGAGVVEVVEAEALTCTTPLL